MARLSAFTVILIRNWLGLNSIRVGFPDRNLMRRAGNTQGQWDVQTDAEIVGRWELELEFFANAILFNSVEGKVRLTNFQIPIFVLIISRICPYNFHVKLEHRKSLSSSECASDILKITHTVRAYIRLDLPWNVGICH